MQIVSPPSPPRREPLWMTVHADAIDETWAYEQFLAAPPRYDGPGWRLLSDLEPELRSKVARLCIDVESVFPASVDGDVCMVVEQEFQASDCGDDWPESTDEVLKRLRRVLLPRLRQRLSQGPVRIGVVADKASTFHGRPTLFVALPLETANHEDIHDVLRLVREFAYPGTQ